MKPGEDNSIEPDRAWIIQSFDDSQSRAKLEQLAEMAANCLSVPIGFVSFFDRASFHYVATVGMKPHVLALDESPLLGTSGSKTPLIITDKSQDTRYSDRKLANASQKIRFLAATPIIHSNVVIGMIGGLDFVAREISDNQIDQLKLLQDLANSVVELQQELKSAEKTAAITTAFYQKNPVLSHTMDQAGVIIQVSDLWCQHFGYKREEVIGRRGIDFLTHESRNYAIEVALPQLRDSGRCSNLKFQWIRKDGSIRDVALSAVVDRDQFGQPITLAVLTDVTDQVEGQILLEQQSAELFNTRERLETAVLGGDVGLWDWNVQDDEVNFSPVWHTQIGETPGTLHGLSAWQSRVHPDDLDDALKRVQECFTGDQSEYESIFRFRHANGNYRTILSRGRKFVDEQGQPRRLIGVHIDITERQQNEDRLALELKRNLDFLRILENGLRAQSVDELIDWLPIELREMVGTHQAQVSIVRNNDWSHAIHNSSLSEKWAKYGDTFDPPDFSGEIAMVCQNQQLVMKNESEIEPYPSWYRDGHSGLPQDLRGGPPLRGWLAVPLLASDGSNLGLIQVSDKLTDDFGTSDQQVVIQFGYITSLCVERLIAQEEERERSIQLEAALLATEFQAQSLANSNRELEQFAYVASHDLRSPLRGISHLTQWITEDTHKAGIQLPDSVNSHLVMLEDQVKRMDQLLVGLLDYSRAGHEEFESEPVDLNALIADVVSMTGVEGRFQFIVPENLPTIGTQRSPLQRIFLNLITNAVKHHDRDTGTIKIEFVDRDDGWLQFSIHDDGPGIPPEHHDHVFEIYQTLKSKQSGESSGMGLAIVKKLVESAGGKIWIADHEGERGTRFSFTWPSAAA